MRPKLHFTAPQNWINDPNGLIYFRGKYHIFYQHFPYTCEWGTMHWGHATSNDLIHFEHLPIALYPSKSFEIALTSFSIDINFLSYTRYLTA